MKLVKCKDAQTAPSEVVYIAGNFQIIKCLIQHDYEYAEVCFFVDYVSDDNAHKNIAVFEDLYHAKNFLTGVMNDE